MKTIENFINDTINTGFDMDGAYGVQCVDGIKKFANYMLEKETSFSCSPYKYAYGLWKGYGTNGVEKYFNRHPLEEAKKGDWIIWDNNSPEAKYSHVAMFDSFVGTDRVRAYGQNQNGKKYFNYCNPLKAGILGVLRLKELEKIEPKEEVLGTITVKSGSWYIRTGAGTNYSTVRVVKGGTKLDYYGIENGWYKVVDGYISSKGIQTAQSIPSVSYYPKASYNGVSIVDGLKSIGVDSSFINRTKIAIKNGIVPYLGTASQNHKMLDLLKQGKLIK